MKWHGAVGDPIAAKVVERANVQNDGNEKGWGSVRSPQKNNLGQTESMVRKVNDEDIKVA